MKPSAKIIADSISERGDRLTTMEVVMHRFVLAEFNTHRVFSRNSASSRAIPYKKDEAKDQTNTIRHCVLWDTAFPVKWASEQAGMQGGDALGSTDELLIAEFWKATRDFALMQADQCYNRGLHKSLVNRLLEPFMWHTVIVTATEWDNFFHQRCDSAAQPEMKAAADAMQLAYYTDPKPKVLVHGEWHLPYVDPDKDEWQPFDAMPPFKSELERTEAMKNISVARCARVSYLTHDGIRDMDKDIELFEKLRTMGHWSPFEHVATPATDGGACGNFVGWRQYRKSFSNENRRDFIPNLPELAQIQMEMEAGVPYKQGVRQ